jgi:outer membrane protein assembly factor BamD
MRKPVYQFLCLCLLCSFTGCATAPAPVKQSAEASFREGEQLYAAKHYQDAIAEWKKVKESYYSPELTTLAELKIADAQFDDEKYIEAGAAYEDFRKLHPTHEKAAYALYRLGLCNFKQITGIDTDQTAVKNAATYFESLLKQYPASEFAADARDKLEICQTKMVQYENYIGRFYLRTDKYSSAIKRLQEALDRSPKTPARDETLLYLGEAYFLAGDKAKGKEIFDRLAREFPASPHLAEVSKFMKKHK